MSGERRCTVYFDGDCPVCSREIAAYRRMRGADGIEWVDAARCEPSALGPGVDREAVLTRFHVRAADGSLVSGAAAFVEIWRRLPALGLLARVAARPGVLACLERLYLLFLRVRRRWYAPPSLRRAGDA